MDENEKPKNVVTFVDNPFGLHEVEQLDDHEELPVDDLEINESDVDGEMNAIAKALEEETQKTTEEMEELVAAVQAEAEKTLADQIAEDEALTKMQAEEEAAAAQNAETDPELRAALPQKDEQGNLDLAEVQSCLEAILFMADRPISLEKLQSQLGPEHSLDIFQQAVTALQDRYKKSEHGIELVEVAAGLQFRTKPVRAPLARKLSKVVVQRLSSGAMETLAIVAYKQPLLKEDIDKVRGVDSSHFVRGLLDRKLIRVSGRSELPGRPMLYETTEDFLQLFGLRDLHALPPLRELEQMIPTSQTNNEDDPRVKEMRRLVGEMKSDNTRLIYDPREDDQILREIKDKVSSIQTSTPYLDEQREKEKQAEVLAKMSPEDRAAFLAAQMPPGSQPDLMPPAQL